MEYDLLYPVKIIPILMQKIPKTILSFKLGNTGNEYIYDAVTIRNWILLHICNRYKKNRAKFN